MRPPLLKVLASSHVSAIAVAVLLFWSIDYALWALWRPLSRAVGFLFTTVVILDVPFFERTLTITDRITLLLSSIDLFECLVCVGTAWLLSQWVYGEGPIRTLSRYQQKLGKGKQCSIP